MLPEVELEVLLFLNRDTLDVYQLSSAKANQMIERSNDRLALRLINVLQVFECYESTYNGPPCEMRFEPFMKGTICIRGGLRDAPSVYEQALMRMRNSFILKLGVSCMPCADFLSWIYDNYDVWNSCRAKLIFLGSHYGLFGTDRCRRYTIPGALLPALVDDLDVTELGIRLGCPQDQMRARQLTYSQLDLLESLTLYLEEDLVISATDFLDYLFDSNQLARINFRGCGRDASQWVTAFIERYIGVGALEQIVAKVVIVMDGHIRPVKPVACLLGVETSEIPSPFVLDLGDNFGMITSCKLYEFKNRARNETLRLYSGRTPDRNFFYLEITTPA